MEQFIENDKPYEAQFEQVKLLIETHRIRAYSAVNSEIILTNWEVGKYVSAKLKSSEWGEKVISQLASYLKEKQANLKGFEKRSLERMVRFYNEYSAHEFASAVLTQLQSTENKLNTNVGTKSPQLENNTEILSIITLINWSSHLEILSACKLPQEQIYYILLAHREHLTVNELRRQIDAGVYERSLLGNSKSSLVLKQTYPKASNLFKDSYMVDYLNLPTVYNEKNLQKGLVEQMKNFILDLGRDFLFIGEEYRIQVGMNDFKIDLLFFHRGLQCLVAIELKTTKFKPEHIGQLDFYLEALDRDVKNENEKPSIGILLCKSTDSEVVEYALSRSLSPTMIAEYKRQLIPKEILQQHLHQYYNEIESAQPDE